MAALRATAADYMRRAGMANTVCRAGTDGRRGGADTGGFRQATGSAGSPKGTGPPAPAAGLSMWTGCRIATGRSAWSLARWAADRRPSVAMTASRESPLLGPTLRWTPAQRFVMGTLHKRGTRSSAG
ncbi:MAG: hypothetical protein JJ960_18785 [Kordiimonadaceae bacterium]|nr:hypothetical protein [Kordiimonadaceae bacterium]